MAIIEYNSEGKAVIKRIAAFCTLRQGMLPNNTETFTSILDDLDLKIKQKATVTQGALNNCHGDWYEWILACLAWNYSFTHNKNFRAILLPNVSSFDTSKLYKKNLDNHIQDLRAKVEDTANVRLVSSNPDFVIINTSKMECIPPIFNVPISKFTPANIKVMENVYKHFIGKCTLDNVVGYFSVKTTLRPDRRLQLSHEGSLMKALYMHLQTREWLINPNGIKYYSAATKVSDSDRKGLKTVATHSIINVQSSPEAAVDEVFEINSEHEALAAFSSMLTS